MTKQNKAAIANEINVRRATIIKMRGILLPLKEALKKTESKIEYEEKRIDELEGREMTNEQPKVTKATVLGENCGACKSFHSYYDRKTQVRMECTRLWPPQVEWTSTGNPIKGTDYPPGCSACPEFDTME